MAKKERILKNKLKQLGNIERAAGKKVPHGLKPNLADTGAHVGGGNNRKGGKGAKRKSGLMGLGDRTSEALKDAQRSTPPWAGLTVEEREKKSVGASVERNCPSQTHRMRKHKQRKF